MSALTLHRIPKGSAFSYTCEEPDCNKKGRYRLEMAGYPVLSWRSVGRPEQAQLCEGCGRQARKLWRELNGEQAEQETRAAVGLLAGTRVQRVDGIDALRVLGYSAEAVAQALKQVGERLPVEEIVSGLVGADELEAVA